MVLDYNYYLYPWIIFFPDAEQDILGSCESSCSHLLRYLSLHFSPLKRCIYQGSGDKGEGMRMLRLSSPEVFGILMQVLLDLVSSFTKSCTKFWCHALHLLSEMTCSFFKTYLSFSQRIKIFRTIRNRVRGSRFLHIRMYKVTHTRAWEIPSWHWSSRNICGRSNNSRPYIPR